MVSYSDRPPGQCGVSPDLCGVHQTPAEVSCAHQWLLRFLEERTLAGGQPGRGRLYFLPCRLVVSPDLPAWRVIKASCWRLCSAGCRTFLPLPLVTGVLNEAVVVVWRGEAFCCCPQSKLAGPTQTASLCASVVFIGAQDVSGRAKPAAFHPRLHRCFIPPPPLFQ